ncbi:MAG: hypothetical protein E4H36_12455 [Spirochaetales bacterium]|nr:MAG: hypothetical protein E4H36_12455 [Spirochaetales bacterium]
MKETVYPNVFLAIDNCFASKRWTQPKEWMSLIKDLGINYIEASADTEADPLYCGPEYMAEWTEEVVKAEKINGVKVVNLYSGHGTYSTLGLGHTHRAVQKRMLNEWIKPMIDAAGRIQAGLGFYCHAFPQSVLQDKEAYLSAEKNLYSSLCEAGRYAASKMVKPVCIEQMYTPHQIPWTIKGAQKMLKELYRINESEFYVTLDTGHQTGQKKYLKPSCESITELLYRKSPDDAASDNVWLGPDFLHKRFKSFANAHENDFKNKWLSLENELAEYSHLFSGSEDSDTCAWIESLGCYSPIIHLQQVTGSSSSHLPFTAENNSIGLIKADKVLRALLQSYNNPVSPGMPERCRSIYLTLEIFSGTAETPGEIFSKIRRSAEYWRRYIPEDGAALGEILKAIE